MRVQRGRPVRDSDNQPVTTENVVVLITEYSMSGASPVAHSIGSGDAFVYVGGKVIAGRWHRPTEDHPASLVDRTGKPIELVPGRTWVELPRVGGTFSL